MRTDLWWPEFFLSILNHMWKWPSDNKPLPESVNVDLNLCHHIVSISLNKVKSYHHMILFPLHSRKTPHGPSIREKYVLHIPGNATSWITVMLQNHQGVSNHWPFNSLLNSSLRFTKKNPPKLHITSFCEENRNGDLCIHLLKGQRCERVSMSGRDHIGLYQKSTVLHIIFK